LLVAALAAMIPTYLLALELGKHSFVGSRRRVRRWRRRATARQLAPVPISREAIAEGADALGGAGGNGSLAVVAAAGRAHRLPFVCVPAGTRNHFALDLGVDRHDLIGALDAFTDGVERSIDVAEVNGRAFSTTSRLGSTAMPSVSRRTATRRQRRARYRRARRITFEPESS
jgi:diacylglycerol kinase family enzyme